MRKALVPVGVRQQQWQHSYYNTFLKPNLYFGQAKWMLVAASNSQRVFFKMFVSPGNGLTAAVNPSHRTENVSMFHRKFN